MSEIQEVSRHQVRLGYDDAAGSYVEYRGSRYLSASWAQDGWAWIVWPGPAGSWHGVKSHRLSSQSMAAVM